MTAGNSFRLASLTLASGLAAACSGDGMDTQGETPAPDSTAETPVARVLKPPPGIDIDCSSAVGQSGTSAIELGDPCPHRRYW